MRFDDKVYLFLKWCCLIFLPAVTVFYAALDAAFCWGYTETVCTVIAAVETFIGTLIGVSTKSYNSEQK